MIAQIFGLLAFIASVSSFQMKTYRQIMLVQTVCAFFFTVHFTLLAVGGQADAITGAVLNGICVVRDLILLATEKRRTSRITLILTVIFSAIIVLVGILTWQSWLSLLFMIAMVLNTIAMSVPSPQNVRLFIMLSAPLAMVYDLLNRSIGGSVNEFVSFFSALIAFLRTRRSA